MAENLRTSSLRYLDADDIVDDRVDFDGLDVRNPGGEKLGSVEGFIVERGSNRPYYVVVDSGGWFSSRHYLVPIGHVRFDPANEALRVDLDRDTIRGFPEVNLDRFEEISEEEARRIDQGTLAVLAPTELSARRGEKWDYDRWSYYKQPDWWRAEPRTELPPPPLTNRPPAEDYDPNVVRTDTLPAPPAAGYARERVTARRGEGEAVRDASDRAQPGDVLGIETGGERTEIGDTARDEDERREEAEETNREILREQRKDERR